MNQPAYAPCLASHPRWGICPECEAGFPQLCRGRAGRYPKVYAKVGTVPALVFLRSRKPYQAGDKIHYRTDPAREWEAGVVTSVEPLKLTRL